MSLNIIPSNGSEQQQVLLAALGGVFFIPTASMYNLR
jgi:hypothetical protein